MKSIEDSSDAAETEAAVRFGLNVGATSPEFAIPEDAVEAIQNDDWEALGEALETWWDNLSMEERAKVMNLDEKKGWEIVENLMWVDQYDEEYESFEPVWEK